MEKDSMQMKEEKGKGREKSGEICLTVQTCMTKLGDESWRV